MQIPPFRFKVSSAKLIKSKIRIELVCVLPRYYVRGKSVAILGALRTGARGGFPALAPLPHLRHASCGRVRGRARVPRATCCTTFIGDPVSSFVASITQTKSCDALLLCHCNPGGVSGAGGVRPGWELVRRIGATALRAAGAGRVARALHGAALGCATLESKSERRGARRHISPTFAAVIHSSQRQGRFPQLLRYTATPPGRLVTLRAVLHATR